ncbi:MAG: ATP-binding protein [Lewinellaceae bacterium]|nr:ATP-binding protein [Lewinellaceae bacterium]
MTNTLQFKISASLKNIIGKDLITDDNIAIFELVKNAYDAYAKNVTIAFENDRITIKDDGKGMDYDDIVNKWLFVAYSAKKEGTEDADILTEKKYKDYRDKINEKKFYAGAKGIGRFSCDRLGRTLTMYTRKVNEPTVEKLVVNWEEFEEDSKKEFVNIQVTHEALDPSSFPDFHHGTILQIEGLHSDWDRLKLLDLKRSLEKLINPIGNITSKKAKTEFKVFIEAEHELKEDEEKDLREKVNGEVKNFIFEILNVKTTQIISKVAGEFIYTELIDRGTPIYKLKEKNPYPALKNGSFNFHLFFLNRKANFNFTRLMGIRAVNFGSIFLFKNGFRIYPYGNPEDDSFNIDRDKAQQGSRALGKREIIGRIDLIGEDSIFNSRFRETSSRSEGLVQTDGVKQLITAFIEKCFKRLEKYVLTIPKGFNDKLIKEEESQRENTSGLQNIESKERIIDLVYKLITNKNETIELLEYNKTFLNIVDEKLEAASPEAFSKLSAIAEKTNDKSFFKELAKVKERHIKLIQEKESAERRAALEEEKRLRAEKEREEARQREEEEKQKRREAELRAISEKQQRKEAELRKREAELQAKEARLRAETAEENLEIERSKNTYLLATSRGISKDAQGLVHSIKLSAKTIDANVETIIAKAKGNGISKDELLRKLSIIKFNVDKAIKMASLVTRANFKTQAEKQTVNLSYYIQQYISLLQEAYDGKLEFKVKKNGNQEFLIKASILELSIIIDDLVSNAIKASATQILIGLDRPSKQKFELTFSDNGKGISENMLKNPEQLFELGVTTTTGSGIGLYNVRNSLETMKAEITFIGNDNLLKGAAFKITFKK